MYLYYTRNNEQKRKIKYTYVIYGKEKVKKKR